MQMTEHYPAEFVVHGGPPSSGPTVPEAYDLTDPTVAGIAIVYIWTENAGTDVWAIVHTHTREIFAEATDPAHLQLWMQKYLVELGRLHRRQEV
jgi:hypothetical protein